MISKGPLQDPPLQDSVMIVGFLIVGFYDGSGSLWCTQHIGELSPSLIIGPRGQICNSPPDTSCKYNLTDFDSPPRLGWTYPGVLQKDRRWHSLPQAPDQPHCQDHEAAGQRGPEGPGVAWAPELRGAGQERGRGWGALAALWCSRMLQQWSIPPVAL